MVSDRVRDRTTAPTTFTQFFGGKVEPMLGQIDTIASGEQEFYGDLQIIDPALKKALNPSGTGLANIDTIVVAGIRVRARFWIRMGGTHPLPLIGRKRK